MLSCSYYCCCFDFFLLFRFVRFYFSLLFCAVSYMSSCWSLVLYSHVFTDGLSWDACHGMNIHTDKTPAADFLSLLFLFDLKQAPTQTKWAILLMWFWLLLYSKSDWHPLPPTSAWLILCSIHNLLTKTSSCSSAIGLLPLKHPVPHTDSTFQWGLHVSS